MMHFIVSYDSAIFNMKEQADKEPPSDLQGQKRKKKTLCSLSKCTAQGLEPPAFLCMQQPRRASRCSCPFFSEGEPTHAAWMQSVLLHSAFRRFLRDSFVGVPFKNNPIVNLREFSLCRKGKFPEICYFYTPESSID